MSLNPGSDNAVPNPNWPRYDYDSTVATFNQQQSSHPSQQPAAADQGINADESSAAKQVKNSAKTSLANRRVPLRRDPNEGFLAGVAVSIARHLSVPAWIIRVAFIGLAFSNFAGFALYGLFWLLIPVRPEQNPNQAPGLVAAEHNNMRPSADSARKNVSLVVAVCLICAGTIMLASSFGIGFSHPLFWPTMLALAGVAIIWRLADREEQKPVHQNVPKLLAPLVGGGHWSDSLRIVTGLALVLLAMGIIAVSRIGLSQLPMVLAIAAVVVVGIAVLTLPWIYNYRRKLDEARKEKLIADTRADMAAHLHDSVLQTLALIQRQAENPKTVASLARRQERELRAWLYGDQEEPDQLKTALQEVVANVEDEWGVSIELVCVGDIELTNDLTAMVRAAKEAITNAAKHSKADVIDVYAEVEDEDGQKIVTIFIRDRGIGFDIDQIDADRQGVRGSIQGRMARHGGNLRIRSAPGEGTEVRLEMKV